MSADTIVNRSLKPVAFWQIHKNPIFLRYLRSRLRLSRMAAPLIITLVITVFTFVVSYNSAVLFSPESSLNAYRTAFLPVFFIQVFIMMFLGTGAVASGITQEYEDGMVDYQRLTPMSPMTKIVGYLFGLPIRQWCLFAVTSFFIAIIIVKGELPLHAVLKVYSVFFLSIILYHLMALIVVHSMKKKRLAGRVIQLLVAALYFIFPLLSQFGFVSFEYLTVRPILKESMLEYIPQRVMMRELIDAGVGGSTVAFFDHQFKAWGFSVILMSSLIISFLCMLIRRWKEATSHLMGKPFALIFFGFFMFFLAGNTLPLAKEGDIGIFSKEEKNSREILRNQIEGDGISLTEEQRKELLRLDFELMKNRISTEAPIVQTIFCGICVLFACLVVYIVTPKNEKYLLGLRRARNLNKKWIPPYWDEALGLPVTLFFMGILGATLYSFSSTLYHSPIMPPSIQALISFIPTVCIYAATVVFVFYLVLEAWENKGAFLLILFIWVIPIMVALVIALQSTHDPTLVWVSSISPIAAYGFGMMEAVEDLPLRQAFYCSFVIQFIIGGFAIAALFGKKRRGIKSLSENVING